MKVAFYGTANAGPSQMAAAFAERTRDHHDDDIEIVTGGSNPVEEIHETVIQAMDEVGIDMRGREPWRIDPTEPRTVDHLDRGAWADASRTARQPCEHRLSAGSDSKSEESKTAIGRPAGMTLWTDIQ